ncbi:MAG: hypothetical protein PVJ29_16205 [Desulfobacterales bacterium]|jgi:hypothetical protein
MQPQLKPYSNFSILFGLALLVFCSGIATPTVNAEENDGTFSITRVEWRAGDDMLIVAGNGAGRRERVTVKDANSGLTLGSVRASRNGSWYFRDRYPDAIPCTILAEARDGQSAESGYTNTPPEVCTVTSPEPPVDNLPEPGTPSDPPVNVPSGPLQVSHRGRIISFEGTRTCLQCHEDEAREVHSSVHYQWKGDATEAMGLKSSEAGKLGGINDFCIYPDINWIGKLTNVDGVQVDGGCAKCHVGMGAKPSAEPTRSQLENIDCLVCHSDQYRRTVADVSGEFRFVPDETKMTASTLDISLPTNDACLNCHTKAGGGNNFKRGDIEEAHRNPTRSFDVHMASRSNGGAGLRCLDCHAAADHRIAGRGTDLRPRELPDPVNCSMCHSETPHEDSRLDKHTARVNCTVCHIPTFAKVAATDMNRDWSAPGDLVAATGLYEPHHQKGTNVVPEYRFFNGTSYFYQFGDEAVAGANGRIVMSAPLGNIGDADAKIHAFKRHLATQPVDSKTGALLPLKIGKFFMTGEIQDAVETGATLVNGQYNGHGFADTERYMGLFHEVAPKEQALSCSSCHDSGSRLDFAALGYTPKTTRNNRPLCTSCHGDESDEWRGNEYFKKVHSKHVTDKKFDCSQCHTFSAAR